MKQSILLELKKFDDGDGMIQGDELTDIMSDSAAVEVLEALGIDVPHLQQIQSMMFSRSDNEADAQTIIDQMLMWRKELPVTVEHMIQTVNLTQYFINNKIDFDRKRREKMERVTVGTLPSR